MSDESEEKLRTVMRTAIARAFAVHEQKPDFELAERFGPKIIEELLSPGTRESITELLNEEQ